MTALPKRKISKERQGKRRAAIKIILPSLVTCPNCNEKKRPHEVCPSCGYYNKREILKIRKKTKKRGKK